MNFVISFMIRGRLVSIDSTDLGFLIKDGMLHLEENKVPSPIMSYDGGYYVKSALEEYTIMVGGAQLTENITLQEGLFLQICHKDPVHSYEVLVQERQSFQVRHGFYQLSSEVLVGRGNHAKIKSFINHAISENHAMIKSTNTGFVVEDLSKKAGIYVNGMKCAQKDLVCGDHIWCMGISIVFMGEYLAISANAMVFLPPFNPVTAVTRDKQGSTDTFERSPRIIRSLEVGDYDIDAPTQKNILKAPPLLLSVGPSLTMSMAMLVSLGVAISNASNGGSQTTVITSGAMAVSMLMGAILWPTLMKRHQKKESKALEDARQEKYAQYIQSATEYLDLRYKRNQEIWNEHLAPSPQHLALYPKDYAKDGNFLWQRKPSDNDFLSLRIGVGEHPFEVEVKVPKVSFTLDEDELKTYPKKVQQQFKTLKSVPVLLSLQREKIVGIFGRQEGGYQLLQSLILQTMAMYSPEEVKTVFLFGKHEKEHFLWAKELPSVWSNDRSIRFMATTQDEAHEVLTYVDQRISEEEPKEVYVLFVTEKSFLEGEKINQYVQSTDHKLPLYSVFLSPKISGLPKNTNGILRHFGDKVGFYSKSEGENNFVSCVPDPIPKELLAHFQEDLRKVPLTLESSKLGIPERVGFLEMYRVGNLESLVIEEKWRNNRSHKSLATPIGLTTGSEPFFLDIHESYHGCHGLVAGTTGAGKTEFLQEFILSLMVNYSPHEINFVLVDFKGGDMARPFMKSSRGTGEDEPHVAATITNLSTNMLHRALTSLKAEIQYRQRVFNQAASQLEIDKIDINSYQQYMKEGKLQLPLPHLVVVIDEFAQLKTQFPDFLQELINVAQVGRSLGIHLILATQKPTGVVDPQIWSNSRFKVCLKVSDKSDSNEMINVPNAASIKQPGRCFVQVGYDELFAEVQTGYSGSEYVHCEKFQNTDDLTVELVDYSATEITSKKIKSGQMPTGKTQIEAVVAELKNVGKKYQYNTRLLWAPLLAEMISLGDIKDSVGRKEAVLGVVDDIRNQKQYSLTFDVSNMEHMLIYGMAGQGKTTLLQSLLFQLFSKNTKEQFEAFLFDFAGPSLRYFKNIAHVTGYSDVEDEYEIQEMLGQLKDEIQRRKALFQEHQCTTFSEFTKKQGLSHILVVIDQYAPWNDRYYKFQDALRDVLSSSVSCGITFLVTSASKTGIPSKVTEQFGKILTFKMPDKADYRELFRTQVPVIPEDVVGRCLIAVGKDICEMQTLLVLRGEEEAQRVQYIVEHLPAKSVSGTTKVVTKKPQGKPVEKAVPAMAPAKPVATTTQLRKIQVTQLDFKNGMFVSGTDPIDVGNAMLNLVVPFSPDVIFASDPTGELKELGGPVVWGEENIDMILDQVADSIRNKSTVPCAPFYIMIPSFSEFFAIVSDAKLLLMEVMLKQHGDLVKVMTGDSVQKLNPYTSTMFYSLAVKQEQGIITNSQELTSQMVHLHPNLVPPTLPANFPYFVYYNQGKWNALEL